MTSVYTSAHVRYADREAVIAAIRRLEPTAEEPIAVWPPRPLPLGIFVGPPHNGWVGVWSMLGDTAELLQRLSATLECTGLLFQIHGDRWWCLVVYQDGHYVARYDSPFEEALEGELEAQAAENLEAQGIDPDDDPEALEREIERLLDLPEFGEELARRAAAQDDLTPLLPLLTPFSSPDDLRPLLVVEAEALEADDFVDELAEEFASHLGLRDVAWDPNADRDELAEGDYGDLDFLPSDFPGFVLIPVRRLPLLGE